MPHSKAKDAPTAEGPVDHRTLGSGRSLCFREEDTEAQKGAATYPGSPSKSWGRAQPLPPDPALWLEAAHRVTIM